MGQKVNPKIFRIGKLDNWDSVYHEKKLLEFKQYTFQNLSMKNFIIKFFKDNGMIVNSIRINFTVNSIDVFVSYYLSFGSIFYKNLKDKKIRLIPKEWPKRLKSSNLLKKTTKNNYYYQQLKVKKEKHERLKKTTLKKIRKIFHQKSNILKLKRIKKLKVKKSNILIKANKNFNQVRLNTFSEQLLNNLNSFNSTNKNISLTLDQLNKNAKPTISKYKKYIKKLLIKLRRYRQSEFFREGLNIIFLNVINDNSAFLLSQFISNNLKKQKRHNFFLRFIKKGLKMCVTRAFSNLKGIKIKIKGRLNGTPRARRRVIKIKDVSTLTFNSKINYSESIAFTPNGTLGVKVWLEKQE